MDVLRIGVLVLALAATQSRSGVIAALVGMAFVVVAQRGPVGIGVRRAFVVMLGVVAIAGLAGAIATRNGSAEGQKSTAQRESLVKQTRRAMIGTTIFGAGPNEVEVWRVAQHLPETKIPLESSYADIVVSIGVPGLVLFVGVLVAGIVAGIKTPSAVPEAGALLTLLIAAGGYQALGSASPLVIIGVLLSSVVARRRRPGYVEIVSIPSFVRRKSWAVASVPVDT